MCVISENGGRVHRQYNARRKCEHLFQRRKERSVTVTHLFPWLLPMNPGWEGASHLVQDLGCALSSENSCPCWPYTSLKSVFFRDVISGVLSLRATDAPRLCQETETTLIRWSWLLVYGIRLFGALWLSRLTTDYPPLAWQKFTGFSVSCICFWYMFKVYTCQLWCIVDMHLKIEMNDAVCHDLKCIYPKKIQK